jgi:hypothetical protein
MQRGPYTAVSSDEANVSLGYINKWVDRGLCCEALSCLIT